MNTKHRDFIFQRWSKVIKEEIRDLASLEQVGERALTQTDVHADAELQSMIRAELQKRRAELERKPQHEESPTAPPEPRPSWRSEAPMPDLDMFNRLAQTLCAALERGDENECRAILGKMRALQKRSSEVIPSTLIGQYQQRVDKRRVQVKQLTDEIAVLAKQAVSASRDHNEKDLARLMRRLTAIHTANPFILDQAGLEDIHCDVADAAAERREHHLTTKKLLDRERTITAQIRKLAAAVRDFHQVACTFPSTSDEYRQAEARYLRTIQEVQDYDAEWFSGVVLELAGLLAEWTVPPLGAARQIDRFLDSITAGLDRIRAEMGQIQSEQELDEGDQQESAAP